MQTHGLSATARPYELLVFVLVQVPHLSPSFLHPSVPFSLLLSAALALLVKSSRTRVSGKCAWGANDQGKMSVPMQGANVRSPVYWCRQQKSAVRIIQGH